MIAKVCSWKSLESSIKSNYDLGKDFEVTGVGWKKDILGKRILDFLELKFTNCTKNEEEKLDGI